MASGARLVAGGGSQRADRQGAVAAAAAWLAGVSLGFCGRARELSD